MNRLLLVLAMRFDPRLERRLKYAGLDRFSWRLAWREAGKMGR